MEQFDLGFAGICPQTYRVLHRAIVRKNRGVQRAAVLSALFLAQADRAILFLLDADHGSDLVLGGVAFTYTFCRVVVCITVLHLLSLICTAAFVFRFRVASGILPRAPLARLVGMLLHVIPLAMSYFFFSGAACLVLVLLDPSNEYVILPLRVIGGAACLAGAAYVSVVLHIACGVSVLEDATLFGALRKSSALLVGKFWVAAAIFVPLDGCFMALQMSLLWLTREEDALGLGRRFHVAAGATMAVALWAVVVVTLVAQLVVYLVCKSHHHEVVVVRSGVELQAV